MARSNTRTPRGDKRHAPEQEADAPSTVEPQPPHAIVGIGASAGGIEALTELLESLPADGGLAFLIVQHLAPAHASRLAEILSRATTMPVVMAAHGSTIEADHVYVAPPGHVMTVEDRHVKLAVRSDGRHRPIDLFFTSLADEQKHRAIGVILSGSANDGTLGLEAVKAAGGITFAQDSSAQQEGMPRSAIASGCIDFVLPPSQIARELVRISRHPYLVVAAEPAGETDADFAAILALLRRQSGVDFSQYKSSTLHRRIRRRVALLKLPNLAEYTSLLRTDPGEIEALYRDILIGVTRFFRDPEAFEVLKEKVFPGLFRGRSRHEPVRVWVLGCATGEETYSMAIALKEYAARAGSEVPIVVYATDLNNASIEKARSGYYPKRIADDVPPEMLSRFFVEADGGYRVTKAIRAICVFARQNVLTDPPFSRMDLISCRNVLIYMEPPLQKKLLPILHFALKPAGVLFLGPAETLGTSHDLFEAEDLKRKIFRKKPVTACLGQAVPLTAPAPQASEPRAEPAREPDVLPDAQREAERALLASYAPPGVLVNRQMEILQFRGDTGPYLSPAPGKASLNLLKMLREGLIVPVRAAMQRALEEGDAVREEGVQVTTDGGLRQVTLNIVAVRQAHGRPLLFWVLFEPPDAPLRDEAAMQDENGTADRLGQELAATREYLQSVIEQQEAANEELQSANEEIQSSNEELSTVNEELQNRNAELNRSNNDFNNLFSSVQMAIVMVWPDLRIRRFTPLAEQLFNLIATDVGRPIGDIKLNFNAPDLPGLLAKVIDTDTVSEMAVQDGSGHWYQLRIRPYRTLENRIDGAVIVLVDVDALKRSEQMLARQAQLLDHAREAIFVREVDGPIVYWNRGAELLYGVSGADALARSSEELLHTDGPTAAVMRKALEANGHWGGELVQRTKDGRAIAVDSSQVLFEEAGRLLVLVTNRDVTERNRLEQSLRQRVDELATADRQKNQFLALLAHELRNPLAPLRNAVHILKLSPVDQEPGARARELIERQVTHMARLVDDLLDAARISRGQVQLRTEPLELQTAVSRAIEATRPDIESRHHRLSLLLPPHPVYVHGDATRLEQIFSNLLHNAAKYTPEGGEIAVTMAALPPAAGMPAREAAVRVRDNGIGIAPEMLPRVFELFMQGDGSLAHAQGGLGIGLHLVRSLVELHGGRVNAHSAGAGQGAEFVVYLPTVADALAARSQTPADAPGTLATARIAGRSAAVRILVVDDSPEITESMSTLLRLQGHAVQTALDGQQALDIAASFKPTVVLLDIGLPGMDGFDVARRMRQRPELADVLLVAVSGYGGEQNCQRALEAGFDRHFLKPLDFEALQSLLEERARGGPAQAPDAPSDER